MLGCPNSYSWCAIRKSISASITNFCNFLPVGLSTHEWVKLEKDHPGTEVELQEQARLDKTSSVTPGGAKVLSGAKDYFCLH